MPEGKVVEGRLGKDDFEIDLDAGTVSCPAGHTVQISTSKTGFRGANFTRATCGGCPLKATCCPGRARRQINLTEHEDLLLAARQALADPDTAEHLRRTRPRIERLLGLLAGRYGARNSRYIGRAKGAIAGGLGRRAGQPQPGEITEERFKASREALVAWLQKWDGKLEAIALEATTGWRWVARELQSRGIALQLTDAGQASALQGQRKRAKTDRLDARLLVMLLAREMLPEAWLAPEEIQRLRDKTRPRKALADDHTRLGAAPSRDPSPLVGVGVLARGRC